MRTITQFIKESLSVSEDVTKNAIIKYLQRNYVIEWKTTTIDNTIENADSYVNNYMSQDITSKYEKIYKISCLNDGTSLLKNSKFSQATIVSTRNNTDVKWFIGVNGTTCDLYIYNRNYYGVKSTLRKTTTFSI